MSVIYEPKIDEVKSIYGLAKVTKIFAYVKS